MENDTLRNPPKVPDTMRMMPIVFFRKGAKENKEEAHWHKTSPFENWMGTKQNGVPNWYRLKVGLGIGAAALLMIFYLNK